MNILRMVFGFLIGIFVLGTGPSFAAEEKLMDKSLEELLSMPVTSAAGRVQHKNEVASNMVVITKEDIQRSGAHNIPDLFYRVPGMQVRKIDGNRYYVSIHSYGSLNQGSLLVLVDGVVMFNPVQSGTNWELLPVTLNEIERIEIIRGPGGVLYSSNAVKGVINIITKKATEKDNYVAARAGSMHYLQEQVGAGGKVNDTLSIRAFAQRRSDSGFDYKLNDLKAPNSTDSDVVGLKTQYNWSPDMSLVLDGKAMEESGTNDGPTVRGGSIKRPGYQHAVSAQFQQKVNDWYDYDFHVDHMAEATTNYTSQDANAYAVSMRTQHNLKYSAWGDHITSLGMEARWIKIAYEAGFLPPADPNQTQKIDSVFLQDEYRPTDKLIFTGGVRATENTIVTPKTGVLYEPRISAVYLLNDLNSLRAVVSKTYRTPSMYDRDLNYSIGPYYLRGNQTLDAEKALTYELGWNSVMLDQKLNTNLSVFFSELRDPIYPGNHHVGPLMLDNNGTVYSYGTELETSYKLTDHLSLLSDMALINAESRPNYDVDANYARGQSANLSKYQFGAGVKYTKNALTLDAYAKWISKYTDIAEGTGKYPSYWNTTLRAAYAFRMPGMRMKEKDAELELVANDLVGANTVESPHKYVRQPDVYAGLKIKF
ncbi:MAG: TonB-dependent receptor [Candidatus Omnitrophica bacterium]|nr:TonB-dependent receptor [Candidatus Omnitrophota bacterium]